MDKVVLLTILSL